MKTPLLIVALAVFSFAPSGWSQAGAANVIKSRARDTAGRPAPPKNGGAVGGGGGTVRPTTRSVNPPASRTRSPQQLIESDLSLIRIKRGVTDELRDRLAGHIVEAAGEGIEPNKEAVTQLAFDVATAVQKHKYDIGYGERKKLAAALVEAVNAGHGSNPLAAPAIGEANTALQDAGLPKDTVSKLMAGMKALAPKTANQ